MLLTFPVGVSETLDSSGALVEGGESRAQVGGVARVRRHLGQATRDLTQGLRPTGRGVRHHGHVVTHVTEVLGQSDTWCDNNIIIIMLHGLTQKSHSAKN